MKRKLRFFSMALAILMLVPLLATFTVSAEDPQDGDKLMELNFKADGEWQPSLSSNENYNDVTVDVSEDGKTVSFTGINKDSKRATWGDTIVPSIPLTAGAKYTFYFHLTLTSGAYLGYYPDGTQGITIKGDGTATLFQWASKKTSETVNGWISWKDKTSISGLEQDFAETFDFDTKTMELFVKDGNGFYVSVLKTVLFDTTLDGATELSGTFFAQGADQTATVSNFSVYKGLDITVQPYDAAVDGSILYKANFKGDSVWTPKTGASSTYDTMIAEVSEDGSSVTLTAPEKDHDKGRAVWGEALDTTKYQAPGSAYTVEFTVTVNDADAEVGFYPDWGTGFIVAPGLNRFRFGQWGNQTKVHATDYYLGTAALTQTYAVEFAVSTETNDKNFYKVTDYRLFVKNGNEWMLIYELSDDVNCSNIADTTELGSLQWTTTDYEMVLRFFRSPSQGTKPVTISDTIVRKGLLSNTLEPKQPTTGGTIDVASKEDGELLYKVNFAGDENFTPGAIADGFGQLTANVDAEDNGKVTVSVPTEGDGLYHYWGGEIKGLPLDEEHEYTIFVTIERSKAVSATDPYIGISLDGLYYAYGNSTGIQLTKGGLGKVRSAVAYSDNLLCTVVGNHSLDYDSTTEPFTQTIAIEIDGPNMNRAIRVYALTDEGTYELFTNSDGGSNIQFMNDNLSLYFFQKNVDEPVTINSVEIYKGRTIEALNAAVEEDNDDDDDVTTTEPEQNTTIIAPEGTADSADEKKGGCASVVSASSLIASVLVLGTAVVFSKKKKDTDAE